MKNLDKKNIGLVAGGTDCICGSNGVRVHTENEAKCEEYCCDAPGDLYAVRESAPGRAMRDGSVQMPGIDIEDWRRCGINSGYRIAARRLLFGSVKKSAR